MTLNILVTCNAVTKTQQQRVIDKISTLNRIRFNIASFGYISGTVRQFLKEKTDLYTNLLTFKLHIRQFFLNNNIIITF